MENQNEVLPFDMDNFLEGLMKDSKKEFQVSDRANKVLMNLKSNQGNVTILPIISKKIGNIYCKLPSVREFKAMTSVLESEDPVWYKILPKDIYDGLTEAQSELYDEVTGLFDQILEYDMLEYTEIRVRNYSLFTGVCLNHINLDGEKMEDNINQPCLFIFPSFAPIDALNTAISTKKSVLGDKTVQWLTKIITPQLTNRQGALLLSFKKPDAPGYQATISFEVNNPADFIEVVDPKRDFTDEASKFEDPIGSFIGWMNNQETGSRFNETVFRELRDNLKVTLKELEKQASEGEQPADTTPNVNGSADPMLQNPPIPGVNPTESTATPQAQPTGKRPF